MIHFELQLQKPLVGPELDEATFVTAQPFVTKAIALLKRSTCWDSTRDPRRASFVKDTSWSDSHENKVELSHNAVQLGRNRDDNATARGS